jgi:hypothetical protein
MMEATFTSGMLAALATSIKGKTEDQYQHVLLLNSMPPISQS